MSAANRFKKFREAQGYTQERVAEMLKTTQQTVQRWESGKAEPNIGALRDLAMIYSTSVDDLLGRNPIASAAVTNSYFSLDGGEEHFWGHLGVRFPGDAYTRWYPITMAQANAVELALSAVDDASPWVNVPTLNNRFLVINFPLVKHIYLLDDAADPVEGDWNLGWDANEGYSAEVYRALDEIAWGGELEDVSDTFRELIDKLVSEEGLDDEEIQARVIDTIIHHADGTERRCDPDNDVLWGVVWDTEMSATRFLELSESSEGCSAFLPWNSVRMIDMPLYKVMDAARRENEELQADEMVTDALRKARGSAKPKQ